MLINDYSVDFQIVMKKFLSILLILIASLCVFSACNFGNNGGEGNKEPPKQTENADDKENPPEQNIPDDTENEEITKMYITVNGNKLEVTLAKNSAVDRLVEILQSGDIVYTADDYGGFEKVGGLGHFLPTSDTHITTQPGDIMLYLGNQIVIFYGSNSWSYTPLGKINGYSAAELAELLGAGQGRVQITISLK